MNNEEHCLNKKVTKFHNVAIHKKQYLIYFNSMTGNNVLLVAIQVCCLKIAMLHNVAIHKKQYFIRFFNQFYIDSKCQFNLIRNNDKHCLKLK